MAYEKDTLETGDQGPANSGQCRQCAGKIQAENMLTSSLRGFLALAENYPNLKADQMCYDYRMN